MPGPLALEHSSAGETWEKEGDILLCVALVATLLAVIVNNIDHILIFNFGYFIPF